ncbi:hypothetical protein K7X08_035482 [Anisodus acutangulus]|uniref:Uncharacterized protein n=1 Tax=Anisodus acutangulus TaxID=402998 RepID=A0A9Q1LJ60_9SOLA|nr:hypothetical protein K7X08_035482 [Anisodus acutangulus]
MINHPSHPDHPSALLSKSKYPGGVFNCDAYNHRGDGFSYHRSDCEYDLHVICASKPLKITQQLHQCQLELTFKNPCADAKCFSCDHHHSFPGATSSHNQFQQPPMTAEMRPNQFMHSASTTGTTGNQLPQTPILSGQVMPNRYTQACLGTAQARSSPLFHSASTGSTIPQHQFLQPPLIQGPVRPGIYMPPPGTNNDLMKAAVQGLVESAAQQVGQSIMQGFIGGGNNSDGNEGSSILRSIFGDSSQN